MREGFVTNVLNPSLATFYLLIIPQFVPRGAPVVASVLTLTAFHVSLALTWHLTWAAAGGTLSDDACRGRRRAASSKRSAAWRSSGSRSRLRRM